MFVRGIYLRKQVQLHATWPKKFVLEVEKVDRKNGVKVYRI